MTFVGSGKLRCCTAGPGLRVGRQCRSPDGDTQAAIALFAFGFYEGDFKHMHRWGEQCKGHQGWWFPHVVSSWASPHRLSVEGTLVYSFVCFTCSTLCFCFHMPHRSSPLNVWFLSVITQLTLSIISPTPPSSPLGTSTLFSASTFLLWFGLFIYFVCVFIFCFSYSTCEWNRMIVAFLWLTLFNIIPSRLIHVVANGKILSFLWLSNIPLCIQPVCVSRILFHSPIKGHLSCFHILTVVNNAAVNLGMHMSFRINGIIYFG